MAVVGFADTLMSPIANFACMDSIKTASVLRSNYSVHKRFGEAENRPDFFTSFAITFRPNEYEGAENNSVFSLFSLVLSLCFFASEIKKQKKEHEKKKFFYIKIYILM